MQLDRQGDGDQVEVLNARHRCGERRLPTMVHVYPDMHGEYFSTDLSASRPRVHGYAVLFANTIRRPEDANPADAVGIERP